MRLRLTYHDGTSSEWEAPNGREALLDDLASRCGYDLRPCLTSVEDVTLPAKAPNELNDPQEAS